MTRGRFVGVLSVDDLLMDLCADLNALVNRPVSAEVLFGHHDAAVAAPSGPVLPGSPSSSLPFGIGTVQVRQAPLPSGAGSTVKGAAELLCPDCACWPPAPARPLLGEPAPSSSTVAVRNPSRAVTRTSTDVRVRVAGDVGERFPQTAEEMLGHRSSTPMSIGPSKRTTGSKPNDPRRVRADRRVPLGAVAPPATRAVCSSKIAERMSRTVWSRSSTACSIRSANSASPASGSRLQSETGREEPLDDRVVELAGDALPVLDEREIGNAGVQSGVLDGDAGGGGQATTISSSTSLKTSSPALSHR